MLSRERNRVERVEVVKDQRKRWKTQGETQRRHLEGIKMLEVVKKKLVYHISAPRPRQLPRAFTVKQRGRNSSM